MGWVRVCREFRLGKKVACQTGHRTQYQGGHDGTLHHLMARFLSGFLRNRRLKQEPQRCGVGIWRTHTRYLRPDLGPAPPYSPADRQPITHQH